MIDGLYRVITSYLCAGFVIENGQVTQCFERRSIIGKQLRRGYAHEQICHQTPLSPIYVLCIAQQSRIELLVHASIVGRSNGGGINLERNS